MTNPKDFSTRVVHADRGIEPTPDIAPPIHTSTSYDRADQDNQVYRRGDHVTTERLEAVLGDLEGGSAVCTSSGMAAMALLLHDLNPRQIAVMGEAYHASQHLVDDGADKGRWQRVEPHQLSDGDLLWVETPSNPRCRIRNISQLAEETRRSGSLLVVDSTFATPVLQNPLLLGADFVVHSTTKFISGHSDALGGAIVTNRAQASDRLKAARYLQGSIPGSLESWLTLRGIRTLPLRVARQSDTAEIIANWLESRVPIVWYPFVGDPGDVELARSQMRGGGGVLSFEMETDDQAEKLVSKLHLFRTATSLGGIESLAEWRRSVDPMAREGLIRLSVGVEAVDDLIADLEEAIDSVG